MLINYDRPESAAEGGCWSDGERMARDGRCMDEKDDRNEGKGRQIESKERKSEDENAAETIKLRK